MHDQWLRVCFENLLMASNNKVLQEKNVDLVNTVRNLEVKIISKDCEIKRLANEINHMIKGVKMLIQIPEFWMMLLVQDKKLAIFPDWDLMVLNLQEKPFL